MYGKIRFTIILIFLLLFMNSNVNQVEGSDFMIAQEDGEYENVLTIDNATLSTNLFSTCLEVGYTRFQFGPNVVADNVTLFLSLDNVSWLEVRTQEFDIDNGFCNGTGVFRIDNSFIQPFPFDVKQNETLYIYLERELRREGLLDLESSWVYCTASIAIVVTHAIVRSWIFTIDWRIPCIFGVIFLSIFTVFLMNRHYRLQMERRGTESED